MEGRRFYHLALFQVRILVRSLLLSSVLLLQQVDAKGVFELKLKSFSNDDGLDAKGHCCSHPATQHSPASTPVGAISDHNGINFCAGKCSTFFRYCLKQYQTSIDPEPPCTYGSKITDVLGENSLNFSSIAEFVEPLRFPFSFAWPGSFSLIAEAWHNSSEPTEQDSGTGNKILLLRHAKQTSLSAGAQWSSEVAYANGNQTVHEFQYRVVCDRDYYGPQCMTYCKARNDNSGHYTCDAKGEHLCSAGWQGVDCDQAICLPGCHPQQGYCEKPGECICRLGFIGDSCDQCLRYPGCKRGSCEAPFECNCDEGWGGLFCNQDLNYCTHHKPCLNGAQCTNTGQGHYTCKCPVGFIGTNCEMKIEDCSHNPCLHGGHCRALESNYTCVCPDGFSGRHCQTNAKTCNEDPCENGASCADTADGYMCLCAGGWEGENCDIEKDECDSSPCVNGGRCVDDFNGYQCVCPMGFAGPNCEENENDCGPNTCQNKGRCIDQVNGFKCECRPGFMGTLCQHNIDDCQKRPCANGATCFDLINDYKCFCRPGFTGKDCSIDINECSSQPCRNGGSCIDSVDDYQCLCDPCSNGKNCENRNDDCIYDITFRPHAYNTSTTPSYYLAKFRPHSISTTTRQPDEDAYAAGRRSDSLQAGFVLSAAVIAAVLALVVPIIGIVLYVLYRRLQRRRQNAAAQAKARDLESHQNVVNQSKLNAAYRQNNNISVIVTKDVGYYDAVPTSKLAKSIADDVNVLASNAAKDNNNRHSKYYYQHNNLYEAQQRTLDKVELKTFAPAGVHSSANGHNHSPSSGALCRYSHSPPMNNSCSNRHGGRSYARSDEPFAFKNSKERLQKTDLLGLDSINTAANDSGLCSPASETSSEAGCCHSSSLCATPIIASSSSSSASSGSLCASTTTLGQVRPSDFAASSAVTAACCSNASSSQTLSATAKTRQCDRSAKRLAATQKRRLSRKLHSHDIGRYEHQSSGIERTLSCDSAIASSCNNVAPESSCDESSSQLSAISSNVSSASAAGVHHSPSSAFRTGPGCALVLHSPISRPSVVDRTVCIEYDDGFDSGNCKTSRTITDV